MSYLNGLKEKYKNEIKTRSDGRQVYIYIDRKQISARDTTSLYKKIIDMGYGKEFLTMSDVFPLWLVWKRDYGSVTGKTLQIYRQHWKKYFGDYAICHNPLFDLTPKDFIQLFRNWTKGRKMTGKQFNNLKSIVNGIYSYAIDELEIVHTNPIREIDMRQFKLKAIRPKNKVFYLEDRKRLLEHLSSKKTKGINELYSLAIQFDFYVTLRIGELKSLKWDNYRNGQIYVEGQTLLTTSMEDDGSFSSGSYENVDHVKGNTDEGYRWIPVVSKAQEILERVRQINPDGEYIFMYKGKQIYTATFNEHLKKYCREIGIDPECKGSHSIRFTVASALFLGGTPITEIQRLLGHTTLQMTMHYLKQILPGHQTVAIMEQCLA